MLRSFFSLSSRNRINMTNNLIRITQKSKISNLSLIFKSFTDNNINKSGKTQNQNFSDERKTKNLEKMENIENFRNFSNFSDFSRNLKEESDSRPTNLNTNQQQINTINSNSTFPRQSSNSNYFFKFSSRETSSSQSSQSTGEHRPKMIILKKSVEEQNLLSLDAPRLPKEITRKWEHFFKRNTKIPLDVNRAVNNFPDKVYKHFFADMKDSFNEKQLLFALKNIFLHRDMNTMWSNIFFNLKNYFYKEKFNKSSKLNLMMLYEVGYLNSKEGGTTKLFLGFFEKISDAIRLQSNKLQVEEMIFVINTMLKYKLYDSYLVNLLFERFSQIDFNKITLNQNIYKIKYFGYEVKLAVALINILNNYVAHCNLNELEISQKDKKLIENIFKMFLDNLSKDIISIEEMCTEQIEFQEILSIFNREYSQILEKSFNNLILVKIEENLNRIVKFPEEAKYTNPISLACYITLLNRLSTNCNSSLFENIFHKFCHCLAQITPQGDLYKIGIKQMNEIYGEILNKEIYVSMSNQLIEISIRHKLFNKEIIAPFLFSLLYYEKICKSKNELNPLFITFGKYNFDEILKTYEFPQTVLNTYYNILQSVDNNIKFCLSNSLAQLEKIQKSPNQIETLLNSEKIKLEANVYEINKLFYKNFGVTNTVEDKLNSSLHYEKDEVLKNENALNLIKYAGISKKYFMSYFMNDYKFKPEINKWNDKQKNSIFSLLEILLDSMLTGINSKIISVENCKNFVELLHELNRKFNVKIYNPKEKSFVTNSTEAENQNFSQFQKINFSLLDLIIKELLLNKKSVYEKLTKVLCFIFNPQNFYDIFSKMSKNEKFSEEKLKNLINEKYNLTKYKIKEETFELEDMNFSNRKVFKDNLTGLIEIDNETSEFLDKFYKDYKDINKNLKIYQNDRYKFEFENFSNFLKNNKDDFYHSSEQLQIFKTISSENFDFNEELKQIGESGNSKDNYNGEKDSQKISLIHLIVNLSKISKTIEEFFLSYTNEEILNILNEFKSDRKILLSRIRMSPNMGKEENDLTDLTKEEILSSNLFLEYLESFVDNYENYEKKPVDFKRFKIDKTIEKLIKSFPIFPFDVQYAFSTKMNPNVIEWLILSNTKYKNTQVTDLCFENKISYLKSQYSNIIII